MGVHWFRYQLAFGGSAALRRKRSRPPRRVQNSGTGQSSGDHVLAAAIRTDGKEVVAAGIRVVAIADECDLVALWRVGRERVAVREPVRGDPADIRSVGLHREEARAGAGGVAVEGDPVAARSPV